MTQGWESVLGELKPSPRLLVIIVLASTASILLVGLYMPWHAALSVTGIIIWQAVDKVRLHALRSHPAALVALQWGRDGLSYRLRNGVWIEGVAQSGGLVSPWLTVVRLKDRSSERVHTRALMLVPGVLGAANFRRLRVYLRWRGTEPDAEP